MNWHWLFEILERELSSERIVLANPFKTRIIAEAQIKKLELPAPAKLLLTQQLALLKELAVRIDEDEQTLEGLVQESPALKVRAQPTRYGTNLGRRGRQRDRRHRALPPRLRSFVATPACVPLPRAAGARLFKVNCYDIATNGSAGPSSRRPGLPSVAPPTSGTSTNASARLARSPASPSWPRRVLWLESPGSS